MPTDTTWDKLTASGEEQMPNVVDTERGVTLYENDAIVESFELHYEYHHRETCFLVTLWCIAQSAKLDGRN